MALLSKDAILTADDLPTKDVDVPEWGGTVRLRGLTGTERDEFETSMIAARGGKLETNLHNVRAGLVAKCVVDEDGQRMFTDKEIQKLGMKSAVALDRLFTAAQKLSGLTEDDVEELVEDFGSGPSESSSSDSPSPSAAPSESSSDASAVAS